MRARNIKPALFKNELLGVADPLLTILFQGLWCLADREGRLEDRPLRIKAEIFPYRENLDVNGYLTVIERLGFIRRYSADGIAIIQVVNFLKHQAPHKTERPSTLPKYPEESIDYKITVKAPLSNDGLTAALPPDSLIPDSLIPDTGYLTQSIEQESAAPSASPLAIVADPVQPPAEKPKPASNGTRLPTDWALSQELGEWALIEGLTRDQIRREADSFRDYWIAQPGARGRKADWPATWRNWIRRSTQSAPGGRNNGKPERLSNAERVARDAERHLAELDRLDREDSQMEQGDRALGYDFVPPDRLAVSGESR